MLSPPRALVPYALFFLSGISGLVFQILWVRQFGNLFGNTIHSASLVTAVFMCGLGAGSYGAGLWADRQASGGALLRAYGGAEILIGVLGASLAGLLPGLSGLSAAVASYARGDQGWYEPSAASQALIYAAAALLLAPVTLLMGGTLTVLIRLLIARDLSSSGARVGALYGFNTAGAALGCLLVDFSLVPALGLWRSQLVAASINVAVGLLALLAAGRLAAPRAAPAETPREPPLPEITAGDPPRETAEKGGVEKDLPTEEDARSVVPLTAAAIALTGFAGMGMEILWLRFLTGSLGQYRAVFSLLLALILAGMWGGAVVGGWVHRRVGRPAAAFIVVEVLFVLSTLGSLALFDRAAIDQGLADAFRAAGSPVDGLPRWAQGGAMARSMAALVLFPSLLMGATFPLANAHVQRVEAQVGRRAGALYLANTVGSVVGSLATGFLFIPALGAQRSALLIGAAAALAILPLYLSARRGLPAGQGARRGDMAFAGAALVLLAALGSWALVLPRGHLIQRSLPDPMQDRFALVSEGPGELLALGVDAMGNRRLWTNGHSMSRTSPEAQRYMRAFAHLPLLQIEAPARVLVICFGVGNTLHAASLHPTVERLDLADLSRHVLEHGKHFAASNGDILRDPRVHVFVNDGRQHLRMSPLATYDLVTLEPPPINFAGVSALYSREFYELARSRSKPGGFVTQWLPIEQLDGPETLALVRAFVEVFPGAVLLSGERYNLILLGKVGGPAVLDVEAVARRLRERPAVADDLARVDLGRLSELAGTFVGGAETLLRATAGVPPVTDDAPAMEYSIASKFSVARLPPALFDSAQVGSFCPRCEGAPGLEDLPAHLRVLGHLYRSKSFLTYRNFAGQSVRVALPLALTGDDGAVAGAIRRSGYLQRIVGIDPRGFPSALPAAQEAALAEFLAAHPDHDLAALRLGLGHLAAGRFEDAEAVLRRAVAASPPVAAAHLALAQALRKLGRRDEALAEQRRGVEASPHDRLARLRLAESLLLAGATQEGEAALAPLFQLDPTDGNGHLLLCADRARRGALDEARLSCRRAREGFAVVDPKTLAALGL